MNAAGITTPLPLAEKETQTMTTPSVPPVPHILVVDDEPSVRESLSLVFQSQGYSTATAEDGFDALLQLRTTTPNVITSDLNMPHM